MMLIGLDCLAMITWSREKGLVEAGKDDGSIRALHDLWHYIYIIGYFPTLHRVVTWCATTLASDWTNFVRGIRNRLSILFGNKSIKQEMKDPFEVSLSY